MDEMTLKEHLEELKKEGWKADKIEDHKRAILEKPRSFSLGKSLL